MATAELTCQKLVELVTDYLDGALDAAERVRFDAHLAECPHCRAYLAEMRTTIRLAGRFQPELLSDEARGALIAAFRGWQRQ
jgi:anti-sigma factor RsiW